MRPLRRLLAVLEPGVYTNSTSNSSSQSADATVPPTSEAAAPAATQGSSSKGSGSGSQLLSLQPVTASDLSGALAVTKPSAQGMEQRYAEFSSRFGQTL